MRGRGRTGSHARQTALARVWLLLFAALLLAGCASRTTREPGTTRPGGYYADDGPGANPPANLDQIPDATPRREPLHRFANRPYSVLGRDYVPATELRPYRERGTASWYGRKFHNQRTATGETYDMYAMTAAHPTLPLPSYARVTHVQSGRSVVVRINDRGPFLHGRIMDLSYAAAWKLGFVNQGSAEVEVEALLPDVAGVLAARAAPAPGAVAAALPAAPAMSATVAGGTGALAGSASAAAAPLSAAVAGAVTPGASQAALAAVRELPLRAEAGEFFVQLGGFSSLENAENFSAVMAFQLSGTGYSGGEIVYAPRIRARDNLFRIEVGPFASRDAARRAGADLKTRLGALMSANPR